MNIIIDEKAKEKLDMMGKNVMTIYLEPVSSCWSPTPEIFVRLNEPEAPDEYNIFEVDDIKIYLYKNAKLTGDTLKIKIAKYSSDLANKEFDVHGLNIE